MNRLKKIESILSELNPDYLEIIDQSYLHKGHREATDAEFTHIKIIISGIWEGVPVLQRHKRIKDLLKSEFDSGMHSLSISFKSFN